MPGIIRMTGTVMRYGWEDKGEVVDDGSFALSNTCRLSTVTSVREGEVVSHNDTDVMTPMAWPNSVACCLWLTVMTVMFFRVNRERILHNQSSKWCRGVVSLQHYHLQHPQSATSTQHVNNTCYKRIQSLIQNHMPVCTVSLLDSRE